MHFLFVIDWHKHESMCEIWKKNLFFPSFSLLIYYITYKLGSNNQNEDPVIMFTQKGHTRLRSKLRNYILMINNDTPSIFTIPLMCTKNQNALVDCIYKIYAQIMS